MQDDGSPSHHFTCRQCEYRDVNLRKSVEHAERNAKSPEALDYIRTLASSLVKTKDAAAVRYLLAHFSRHVGHPDTFFRMWHKHLLTLSEASPGHGDIFISLRTILHLFILHSKTQTEIKDDLTDTKDLQRVLNERLKSLLRNNPTMIFEAAKELGWTVLPPPDEM